VTGGYCGGEIVIDCTSASAAVRRSAGPGRQSEMPMWRSVPFSNRIAATGAAWIAFFAILVVAILFETTWVSAAGTTAVGRGPGSVDEGPGPRG
jgi:hypothetical protein